MTGLAAWAAMGGYAGYVWPAYGVAAAVLTGLLVVSIARLRDAERWLAALEQAVPRRARRAKA